MTINSTTRTAGPFIGNDITTTYAFAFKVFSRSDVLVVRSNTNTGLSTSQNLDIDYSVTLNPDQNSNPGGSVIMAAPIGYGNSLVLTSQLPYLQPLDLTNQGGFYPHVISDAFDRLVIYIQQLFGIANRSLRIPVSDTGVNTELPQRSARANNLLAFDANGNPVAVAPAAQSATALQTLMATSVGAAMIGWHNNYATTITVEQGLDILYMGVKNPFNPRYAGGATGDGITDDYAAVSACYADGGSPYVHFPAGKNCLVKSTVSVPSGTITTSPGGQVSGPGNIGIFTLAYPSTGTTFEGLTIDGNKLSGTADVVTLIYAPGSTATPANKGSRLTVRNCTLRNGSAGVGFENAIDCKVHDNHISAMYRHTTGPSSGSYGYGVVYNGCQNSKVYGNTIGTEGAPIERHGIYMPVFLDSQAAPTFTNFCSSVQIFGNRISVKHDPANEPYSSCVESWNYFDISITGNHLIGGMRGINATPEYQNGSRVQISSNFIKDSEIGIRNDRATKGVAPGTYYFDEYQIANNIIIPLTSVAAHQAVFLQGVKKIIFDGNYCKGNASTSFAFGYYDVAYNNITADLIRGKGNIISGFAQGFYLANVTKFVDDSAFSNFTGNPLPYVRNVNIVSSEMSPKVSPATALYIYNTGDWAGVSYFETALGKTITHNGTAWMDAKGIRVRGPTANRPSNISSGGTAAGGLYVGLEYGFKYYDTDAAAMLFWNGICWATAQQPAPPLGDTTANLNTFKTNYPAALSYGAMSWNTTTSKPVWFNANTSIWVYADGTAM